VLHNDRELMVMKEKSKSESDIVLPEDAEVKEMMTVSEVLKEPMADSNQSDASERVVSDFVDDVDSLSQDLDLKWTKVVERLKSPTNTVIESLNDAEITKQANDSSVVSPTNRTEKLIKDNLNKKAKRRALLVQNCDAIEEESCPEDVYTVPKLSDISCRKLGEALHNFADKDLGIVSPVKDIGGKINITMTGTTEDSDIETDKNMKGKTESSEEQTQFRKVMIKKRRRSFGVVTTKDIVNKTIVEEMVEEDKAGDIESRIAGLDIGTTQVRAPCKQSLTDDNIQEAVTGTETDKRKAVARKGRPRKSMTTSPVETSENNLQDTIVEDAGPENDTCKAETDQFSTVTKRGRPRKSMTTSPVETNSENNLQDIMIEDNRPENDTCKAETDQFKTVTKRGRPRKSMTTSPVETKSENNLQDMIVEDNGLETVTKRGRPRKAGTVSPDETRSTDNLQDILEEISNVTIQDNSSRVESPVLSLGTLDLPEDKPVPKKRRRSADAATLRVQIMQAQSDDLNSSEGTNSPTPGPLSLGKGGRKRKYVAESEEEILNYYRNKKYVKPEDKKPWTAILEHPHSESDLYGKKRLARHIEFEKPTQMKLRRRLQRALKNGWDPKKKQRSRLNDDFVREKLERVWGELDDDSSSSVIAGLQSIVNTD